MAGDIAATADVVTQVAVEGRGDGCYRLDWSAVYPDVPLTVSVAASPRDLGAAAPLASGQRNRLDIEGLEPGRRHYFALAPPGAARLTVAQRDVPFTGCVNFRDLGGYRASDGRRLHWGTLYRSGHMANLSAADQAWFATLDVRSVCDFRVAEEQATEAMSLPGAPRFELLGITPGIGDRQYFHRIFAATRDPRVVLDAMHDIMRSFVTDTRDKFRRMFEILLESEAGGVLLNCSAGKERTGIGAALTLTALGVPRATVLYDFMLSQRYFPAGSEIPRVREKYGVRDAGPDGRALIMPLLETRESYLQSAFAVIDRDFGTLEAFLQTCCGLGPAELRRLRDRYTH